MRQDQIVKATMTFNYYPNIKLADVSFNSNYPRSPKTASVAVVIAPILLRTRAQATMGKQAGEYSNIPLAWDIYRISYLAWWHAVHMEGTPLG